MILLVFFVGIVCSLRARSACDFFLFGSCIPTGRESELRFSPPFWQTLIASLKVFVAMGVALNIMTVPTVSELRTFFRKKNLALS